MRPARSSVRQRSHRHDAPNAAVAQGFSEGITAVVLAGQPHSLTNDRHQDGPGAAPANAPAEVDTANAKGVYKITMMAAEASCQVGSICGVGSTGSVVILPATVIFENLPTVEPAPSGACRRSAPAAASSTPPAARCRSPARSRWGRTTTSRAITLDLTQPMPVTNHAQAMVRTFILDPATPPNQKC